MQITKRILFVSFFVCAACIAAFSQSPVPSPPAVEPETVFTEEIKVNVAAFDQYGDSVSNVIAEDLVIVEDGRLHQANSVRKIPANVLIVLDTGGELRRVKNISQTRDTAKKLVKYLEPNARISTLEYHDKARVLTDWTTSKKSVLDDLDNKLFFGRRSIFSDALELAATILEAPELENRHLVLITDGTDSFWSDERRQNALRQILRSNISVHVISYTRMELIDLGSDSKIIDQPKDEKTLPQEVIDTLPNGVRDVANTPQSVSINTDRKFINTIAERKTALLKGEEYLEVLADSTSGLLLLPDDQEEMLEKTRLVAKAIESNYVVTYTPKRPLSESQPGETRIIEVSSKKEGLFVQARRKLVIGKSAER